MKDIYEKNAAALLRESNEGVLSTMSKNLKAILSKYYIHNR